MMPDEIWKIAKKILKYAAIAVAGFLFLIYLFEGSNSHAWPVFAPVALFAWWIANLLERIERQLSRIEGHLQNNAKLLSNLKSDCSDVAHNIRTIRAEAAKRF